MSRDAQTINAARAEVVAALKAQDLPAATRAIARLRALYEGAAGQARALAAAFAELADFSTVISDHAAALGDYDRAVGLQPGEPRYRFNRATVRRFLGNFKGAEEDYDRVIELDPRDAQAWNNRSQLRLQTAADNHVPQLEQALAGSGDDWHYRVPLHYALAKEYEDLGDHAASWRHLSAGAALRRRHLQYDIRSDLDTVEDLIRAFAPLEATPGTASTASAAGIAASGGAAAAPIFILGLPRTGSTLVDRILGRHPQVYCAGELSDFGTAVVAAARNLLQPPGSGAPLKPVSRRELIQASATLDFTALGQDYLARTRARVGNTPRFTDKLPVNYLYCGLIARALPQAAIVHVRRHPLAVCYAMFKVLFDQGYPFSYDLSEIADYYIGYRRLMTHWQATLPGRIHDLAYEQLVQDPEGESRRLLGAVGLPWDERCLEPHRGAAAVMTASAAQVRRPIYSGSVAQWRHYERELAPLAQRLRAAGIPLDS